MCDFLYVYLLVYYYNDIEYELNIGKYTRYNIFVDTN